jgi:hypothetical protein
MSDWIKGAIKHPGAFTAAAKKRGMTVTEFRQQVLRNKDQYSDHLVRQAQMAKTLSKMRKR